MPSKERLRWLELLSYVHALVYHDRNLSERAALHKTIEASVLTDDHRQEILEMRKTIANELKEEGRREEAIQARKQTLLRLLRKRFGSLPSKTVEVIDATDNTKQLDAWLDRFAVVEALEDMEIGPTTR
jgi:hypothetical protein